MKDFLINACILLFFAIIILKLDNIQTRLDDLSDVIVGSNEAIVTELYRYKETG